MTPFSKIREFVSKIPESVSVLHPLIQEALASHVENVKYRSLKARNQGHLEKIMDVILFSIIIAIIVIFFILAVIITVEGTCKPK